MESEYPLLATTGSIPALLGEDPDTCLLIVPEVLLSWHPVRPERPARVLGPSAKPPGPNHVHAGSGRAAVP
ncbi:hypothetical protein ACX80H_02830 [Arthrobacter sp. MDT2-2]